MGQFEQAWRARDRASAQAEASTRRVRAGTGYLARHWRGEVRLPHALLLNALVLGALLPWAVAALGGWLEYVVEPGVMAVGLTVSWVAVALGALWHVVGVVRAAARHTHAGLGRLVPGGAVLAGLMGVMMSAGVFVRAGLPQIVEASQFALGKDPIGSVQLQVRADGSELELTGPIVFGVTSQVRDALTAHPDIVTLHLNSPGGRVVEARELRDLIRERGITTIAAGNCASACVIAFMAGRERLLAPKGSLGFHRYRSPGLDEPEIQASMAIDRRDMSGQGVPAWFLNLAYATPHSEMWRPPIDDLKIANIVTGELAADGTRRLVRHERRSIEAQAVATPLYSALKSHEPALYEELIDAMEQGAPSGLSLHDVGARTRPLIHRLAAKYVPAASDDAIVQATVVATESMRALLAQSPDACYGYIVPGAGLVDLSALPLELRERDLASTAALIRTGAGAVAQPIGSGTGEDLQRIFARLLDQFGDDAQVLDRINAPGVDAATVCHVVIALYERALSLPPPRHAQLLRLLLAGR